VRWPPAATARGSFSPISREGACLSIVLVVVIIHTIVCVTDFLADLAVTLQSAALGLGSGFAARLAFLPLLCWSCESWLRAGDADEKSPSFQAEQDAEPHFHRQIASFDFWIGFFRQPANRNIQSIPGLPDIAGKELNPSRRRRLRDLTRSRLHLIGAARC